MIPCKFIIVQSSGNAIILSILKSSKLLNLVDSEWDMKFYFLHMKSNVTGTTTTLKHSKTINGNVKILSKRIKRKDKGNVKGKIKEMSTFTLRI